MYDHISVAGQYARHVPSSITSNGDGTDAHWSSLVGIVTAIIGNVIISFALNTQRYAHIRIDREYNDGEEKIRERQQKPKRLNGYGAAARQEEVAEERARLNAGAPGPGNDENSSTNAFGQDPHRRQSGDSEETVKPQEKNNLAQHQRKSYLKSPIWWVGIILMAIGETGNFLAYGFAPASIVGPLGVVALIINCLIAPLMLKEPFRQRDFWGVLIAIGGVVTVVLSANTSEAQLSPDELWDAIRRWEFLTYVGITCLFIVVLMVASPRYGKKTILIDLGLVGLFGGYTALSTKGIASMLSASLWLALTFSVTYFLLVVLVISAVMQIRYINRALSNFSSTQVIPVQFVLFTLSVILGSAVLYRDFEKTTTDQAIKFIVGCLLTFSGVWLITSGRSHTQGEQGEEGHNDEAIRLIDEETEMEDERTPLKHEQLFRIGTNETTKPKQYRDTDGTGSGKSSRSPSIPSVAVTPCEGDISQNPWLSSTDHLENVGNSRPRTPSNPRESLTPDNTPYFTAGSAPSPTNLSRAGILKRTGTAPADPQTPTRGNRAPSPPKADATLLVIDEHGGQQSIFRTARGSMSRLLPGPFLGPLSSGSLNSLVAESLRKGEGSPQGPVRSRSWRRPRAAILTRSERNRRRSTTAMSAVGEPDLENGLATPALGTWQTGDSTPSTRERSHTGDFFTLGGSQRASTSKSTGLPTLSPTLTRLFSWSKEKDRGKRPEGRSDDNDNDDNEQQGGDSGPAADSNENVPSSSKHRLASAPL